MKTTPHTWSLGGLTAFMTVLWAGIGIGAPRHVRMPMVCSHRSSDPKFDAYVTMPGEAAPGSIATVRIDSVPSGRLAHYGLHYFFDMRTDYAVSPGGLIRGGVGAHCSWHGHPQCASLRVRTYGTTGTEST